VSTDLPSDHGLSGDHGLSRRRFLAGIGASASLVALRPQGAAATLINKPFASTSTLGSRFGRIFAIPSFAQANSRTQSACLQIGQTGGLLDAKDDLAAGPILLITDPTLRVDNPDNPTQTAGVHFLGQFIDHDLTLDQVSQLGVPAVPEQTTNTRTPALDLDSVYGGGPGVSPQLYNPADPAKFLVGNNGVFEDLPRRADGTAIIGDPRNDENLMLAGLTCAFLLFHNNVVDLLRSQGKSGVFAAARQLVLWHYQWIILHQFLPLNIGQAMVDDIVFGNPQFFDPFPGAFIPIEFSAAAYRFGHSQILPSYRANLAGDNGKPFFGMIFSPDAAGQSDPIDLRGGFRAPRRFIGWQTFFDFGGSQTANVKPNKLIDTSISTPLFQLPPAAIVGGQPPVSLMQRDLLRHLTWSIPSGQDIAQYMGAPIMDASFFPELKPFGFDASTPLMYYVMREAAEVNNGTFLGPVGGRIVGETIIGLMLVDPGAFLNTNPTWTPTLPGTTPGDFTMSDLLRFAKVDPASRGQ